MQHLDDYPAVSQLGITLSSLGLGWIGEPAVAALIEPVLGQVVPPGTVHLVAFVPGFGFITSPHVVFGELAPETFAIQEAPRIALLVAPLMKFSYSYSCLASSSLTGQLTTSLASLEFRRHPIAREPTPKRRFGCSSRGPRRRDTSTSAGSR
nr:CNNM domain-containing protein [Halosegnis sp. DT85]